ncbi:flagellar basal body-associated FliL family protein [Litoribrevibacter albus]|uniref:Flagellar protein FliL n=1 Tax=Litoribrevibacter albus TaxID=1473156 RepID=A0AA37SD19_9GAMM|nr:flagellar basal body-associated FliL family protein [Litoribrevibacter albus]GLQ32344.1 flagellar basal body-associated protein FliL [Litoribrevibacter albus]
MADEQDIDMSDPQQSGKKRLFMVIGVVALVSLLSIGGVLFLVLGGEDEPAEEAVPEQEAKRPALYMEIQPAFVVTYKVGMRQRYLQVYVSLMVRDPVLLEALKNNNPALQSALLQMFGEQDFNELKTPEGKDKLRSLALEVVNKVVADNIGEGSVEKVLFTNIVMQ